MVTTYTTNKQLAKQATGDNVDAWGPPLNSDLDIVDSALGGSVTVSTTGGTTNLSTAQSQNLILNITGALVANAIINYPALGGLYVVQNNTTGAFTVTIGCAGGGSSIVAAQGVRTIVMVDGTNARIADDRIGAISGIVNSQLATMAAGTLKGNNTGGTTTPIDGTLSSFLDLLSSTRGAVLYRGAASWAALGVGTAGQALTTNGAGADPSWGNVGASLQGGFKNLTIANGGAPNTQVSVLADAVTLFDGSASYYTAQSVNLSLSTGTSGANGIDTGSVAPSTWYSVWVIYNGTTVAGLLSTSATAPTMPGTYTLKARVGWVRTDGSSILYRIRQKGRRAQYVVTAGSNTAALPLMGAGTTGSIFAPTWTSLGVSSFVPSTAGTFFGTASGGSNGTVIVAPSADYGAYNSGSNPPPVVISATGSMTVPFGLILETTNIYMAANSAGALVQCQGWDDNL